MIKFLSLASGSSGNCYYLGSEEGGLLIDAGIPMRSISKALKNIGVTPDSGHIQGVLVTHEHADHVRTIGVLGSVQHLPIYASHAVHNSIETSRFIHEDLGASRRHFIVGETFCLAGFEITSFVVPHDSVQNVGYHITRGAFSLTLATDVGHITPEIKHFASLAKYLVIEANYDPEMLRSGPYPDFLKDRVSSPTGHLSNVETASLLVDIYTPKLQHVWLCHLSKDNNHPELCWKHIEHRLYSEQGIRIGRTDEGGLFATREPHKDLILDVLPRTKPTPLYLLDE